MNLRHHLLLATLLLTTTPAISATTSITWWHYDQYAQYTPYYSHMGVLSTSPIERIANIDLNDSGWGYRDPGTSSYHVSVYNEFEGYKGPLRSIGWHQFEVTINDTTDITEIRMDGNLLLSGTTTRDPGTFYFSIHDYYGGAQETSIDDFEIRVNGSVVYQQGFDDPTLPAGWFISHQNPGTYIASGDSTTVRSGTGSMAVGATAYGDLFAGVAFDLTSVLVTSVPEPSTGIVSTSFFYAIANLRRRRTNP